MWITRVSIANPVFATMVMVALCVLGLFSYARLGVEQLPDVQPPVAFIDVAYPGASPDAVEREVSKPIEEGLNSIAGIKHITSRSFEGRSQTSVEFTLDADMARAMQDVRDRMAVVQGVFPKDAKTPTVARFNNDNSSPVVVAALLSAARSPRELSILADQTVARRLQRVEGVASVEVNGLARREVRIDLDPDRLRAYAITPAQVAAGLREAHSDQPVGLLSDATQDAILRVEGRVADPRQFADMVVAQRNGLPLRLADLGTVVEREREPESVARVNGQRAVNFNVFKQQDANTVATGEAIKGAIEELRKSLPADVELRLVYASSDFVKGSLQGVQHTLIEGALLTVAIVFLFLHSWRSTVITGLTLPIAVIASFIAVHAFGFTLNFMTMMALSLCIGLLIDDAIVVRENIVRHLHLGKDHFAAARDGTEEIGLAVMATTFAICAVFVPVAFMGGIVGKFFHPFGITVTVAVLVSLFVSFTLDPMLSSRWPDPHDAPGASAKRIPGVAQLIRAVDHGMDVLHAAYERLIHWVFERPRRNRAIVLAVGGASFLGALALAPVVGSEFVPQTDQGFTQLAIRMTVGSSLARSDEKVRQVEAIVAAFPEVQTISTNVGGQGTGLQVGRNQAVLNIGLVERARRARSQKQVEDAIRAEIAKIAGIEVSVGFDRSIYVAVLGNDSQALARVASDLAEQMKKIPGITDVELSVKPGIPAYAVRLKPGAVRELGLTAPQLAASLRAYVNGEVGTYWTTPDGEQAEVLLRLPEAQRQRVAQMGDLPVAFAKDGTPIPLAAVASIEPVTNPEVIRRQDLQRREAIFAGVQGRPAGDVGADVQKLVKATALPPGVRFDVGGATREQQDAFAAMLGAMGLAVIFIYIVLASQFGSFLQPIAIMASLPLSLIGVMLALLAWRSTLNVFSMIGLIMLMGLVTKNAILLVDFANRALKEGASVPEALLQAGQIRMRPIIMTTAAMVFGMLPLALALNDGGELQAPMGRAIIGGVITSTLLTLVVVPVLWSVLVGGSLSRSPQPRRAGEEPGAQTSPAR
ncbi:MAG: efflux RND transporter permease subunit [Piscinibacter sp.]|uniref:efflux RND transporter permease subunit n=1 Tax=Piscinibacter sp. TaxID=1903157 RepID=UPI001B63A8DF|nr:efflux RND transporter permease subunit [Piscinibacter sp.]MBP5989261.1 efflux RND transporter permease subunit [Piscinibacter sp.]MBP6026845.1 efflux RND transporter permease subunit [Piscinibacter sp.]